MQRLTPPSLMPVTGNCSCSGRVSFERNVWCPGILTCPDCHRNETCSRTRLSRTWTLSWTAPWSIHGRSSILEVQILAKLWRRRPLRRSARSGRWTYSSLLPQGCSRRIAVEVGVACQQPFTDLFFIRGHECLFKFPLTVPGVGHRRTWHGEGKSMWGRIWQLWLVCGRAPVLVAEGDFQQFPPPIQNCGDEDSRRSRFFNAQAVLQLRCGMHPVLCSSALTSLSKYRILRGIVCRGVLCVAPRDKCRRDSVLLNATVTTEHCAPRPFWKRS